MRPIHLGRLPYQCPTGQWRHSTSTEKLTAALQIAQRIYSLAREQNEPALMIGAMAALAITHYFLGNFETSGQTASLAYGERNLIEVERPDALRTVFHSLNRREFTLDA